MAEDQGSQERTEKASPRKRRDARLKGTVARSNELNSTFVLFAGAMVLYLGGRHVTGNLFLFSREMLGGVPSFHLTQQSLGGLFLTVVLFLVKTLGPLAVAVAVIGVLVNASQVGLVLSGQPLMPKLERLNPIAGAKRLFSGKAFVELMKSLLKMAVIGWIAYSTIRKAYPDFIPLADAGIGTAVAFMTKTVFGLFFKCIAALAILSVFDYAYQRWAYEKDLKMTRREVKDEMKHTEGNPQVKSKIRSIQQSMARQRMMTKVPEADVVIRNPTHFAVAVKYAPGEMAAPQVVAKGTRLLAQKIIEVAEKNKVPVVENRPLAQALYKSVKVGQEIPAAMYKAVAEILAYVYRIKGKKFPS